MNINRHIQHLYYPEYAGLSSLVAKIDLAHHFGVDRTYDYILAQDKVLIKKISEGEHVHEKNILVTAGADSALHHIAEVFLDEGKIAVIPSPSFGRFEFHTKVVGATAIFVPHTKFPYNFDLDKITRVANKQKADVVFLTNPNNPTGELISKSNVKRFIGGNTHRLVVVDEALLEESKNSVKEFVNEHKNLIVIKSFSKLLGVPGLRVGYIIAHPSMIAVIGKTVSPYEVSSLSLLTVRELLSKSSLGKIHNKQKEARSLLRGKDIHPFRMSNTQASVVLIDGPQDGSLYEYLQKHGVLSVDGKNFRGLEKTNTVRIVVNDKNDIQKFISILNQHKKEK